MAPSGTRMNTKTDAALADASPTAGRSAQPARKPKFALLVATACGLGNLPKAPGTWGSLGGILVALAPWWGINGLATAIIVARRGDGSFFWSWGGHSDPFLAAQVALAVLIAAMGVW